MPMNNPAGYGGSAGGAIPGTKSNQNNAKMALIKLNTLMFQSFAKLGNAGLAAITAQQNGDQMSAQRSTREMMIASKELNDVKRAMSMAAQPAEEPLAGGRTGVQEPRARRVDAMTGRPIDTGQPNTI
jgi:hypothetical protein